MCFDVFTPYSGSPVRQVQQRHQHRAQSLSLNRHPPRPQPAHPKHMQIPGSRFVCWTVRRWSKHSMWKSSCRRFACSSKSSKERTNHSDWWQTFHAKCMAMKTLKSHWKPWDWCHQRFLLWPKSSSTICRSSHHHFFLSLSLSAIEFLWWMYSKLARLSG